MWTKIQIKRFKWSQKFKEEAPRGSSICSLPVALVYQINSASLWYPQPVFRAL